MLPGETWLEALRFSDYETLVYSKLATHRLLHTAMHYAAQLAARRDFEVIIYDDYLTCDDLTVRRRRYGNFDARNPEAMKVVFRRFGAIIGPHTITRMVFVGDSWNMWNIDGVFNAAPPLKFPEAVYINKPAGSTYLVQDFTALMQSFVGLKTLRLTIKNDAFCLLNWTFLRHESACELQTITFCSSTHWSEPVSRAVEELLKVCATLPRLLCGHALVLDFTSKFIDASFAPRVVELLSGSGRNVVFKMKQRVLSSAVQEGDFALAEGSYDVETEGAVKRYRAERTGITVEVHTPPYNGSPNQKCTITIHSAAFTNTSHAKDEIVTPHLDMGIRKRPHDVVSTPASSSSGVPCSSFVKKQRSTAEIGS